MSLLVPLLLLLIAAAHDLRRREVPDWIALALLGWAATAATLGIGELNWLALGLGLAIGLMLTVPLFCLGGIGGADVKLIAALGSALGQWPLVQSLFWIALAGGALALVAQCRGQRTFAYVPAMFLGLSAFALWSAGWNYA